jgi:oligoendopeptidase F
MPQRTFVPQSLNTSTFTNIEPLFQSLESRPLPTKESLEQFLLDASELGAVLSEESAKRYINMTCHTDDPAAEKAYVQWVEEIQPRCKPHWQKLDEKFLSSPFRSHLDKRRYEIFDRSTANDVALFREENIPLQTEEAKLDQQYNKISGSITIFFDSQERTVPQMARYLEEPDRPKRQAAWEALLTARYQHRDAFDSFYDQQIELRNQMAKNAGLNDYVEYAFRMYRRFDYTPSDCFTFHDAIREACVPVVKKMLERRRQKMNLEKLRPWDTSVDPQNRPPLRPFKTAEELVAGTKRTLGRVAPEFADALQSMANEKLLDLDSRKGKAPGGYQYTLDEARKPFIFMNAAGMHGDIQTLLHEAGHALHALASAHDPLLMYRAAPIEFCEVASMGMELMAAGGLREIYNPEDHARAVRQHLEGILGLLPWIAQVDAFQHWIYTHPGHSHQERNAAWLDLDNTLANGHQMIDYSGYEPSRDVSWQRQRHLWGNPFYYIEYGIAQLGALQLWANYKKDLAATVKAYNHALSLGGSRPLPELFEAANIRFDFTAQTLNPLMQMIDDELARLPE